jgi:hypothetical protein
MMGSANAPVLPDPENQNRKDDIRIKINDLGESRQHHACLRKRDQITSFQTIRNSLCLNPCRMLPSELLTCFRQLLANS